MNALLLGPAISFLTSTAVYYWQIYAPVIAAIEGLLNLNNNTAGHFDADRIKEIVEVFQEMILKIKTSTSYGRTNHVGWNIQLLKKID